MKFTELKLPKTTDDLRINHFMTLATFSERKMNNLNDAVEMVADFMGVHVNQIKTLDYKDVIKMYHHICWLYSGIKITDPKKEIELNGEVFEFVNPEKTGIGWHIDFEGCDIEKDPVRLACMYYFPKGQIYGATDENYNIINPIASRREVIEKYLTLQDFINCNAFFLRRFEKSMSLYTAKVRAINWIKKNLKFLIGKKQLTF
jgi:hypothetical protein